MADTTVAVPTVAHDVDSEPKGRGGKLKKILFLVVLLAVAGFAVKTFVLSSPAEAGPPPPPEEGEVVTIGQMTTSISGGTGTHYARIELAAVANAEADATALEERFPLMRDQALSVLMGFTVEQLRTVEGADQLRTALTERAQVVWEEDEVLRIVLTDLLVQ